MTALGAFSSGDVLTAADLNAIGAWTTFTPSWTNVDPTSATENWKYAVVNNVMVVSGYITFGVALPISGSASMDLPGGATAINFAAQPVGQCFLIDGSTTYQSFVNLASSTSVRFAASSVSGSNLLAVSTSALVPFTWGSGDRIRATFTVVIS